MKRRMKGRGGGEREAGGGHCWCWNQRLEVKSCENKSNLHHCSTELSNAFHLPPSKTLPPLPSLPPSRPIVPSSKLTTPHRRSEMENWLQGLRRGWASEEERERRGDVTNAQSLVRLTLTPPLPFLSPPRVESESSDLAVWDVGFGFLKGFAFFFWVKIVISVQASGKPKHSMSEKSALPVTVTVKWKLSMVKRKDNVCRSAYWSASCTGFVTDCVYLNWETCSC